MPGVRARANLDDEGMPVTKPLLIARRCAMLILPIAAGVGMVATGVGTVAAKAPKSAKPAKAAELPGDVAHGQIVFAQCKACHSVEPGKNLIGPSLDGIVGKKAAAVTGYSYSPAMKASGLTWTPKALSDYLMAPAKTVPGTKMPFAGLSKEADRTDVIAYLAKN